MDDLVESTLVWLRAAVSPRTVSVLRDGEAQRVVLPTAPGADSGFQVWFHPDGRREIRAVLCDGYAVSGGKEPYFWTRFFMPEDHLSLRELSRSADACIRELLRSDTRIRQRRGLLFTSFRLQRKRDATWVTVSGAGVLRGTNFAVPPIASREHMYSSPAIVRA